MDFTVPIGKPQYVFLAENDPDVPVPHVGHLLTNGRVWLYLPTFVTDHPGPGLYFRFDGPNFRVNHGEGWVKCSLMNQINPEHIPLIPTFKFDDRNDRFIFCDLAERTWESTDGSRWVISDRVVMSPDPNSTELIPVLTETERSWFPIQWRQELHDRLFHGDVYTMQKINRLTHLVLHLAKYNGKYYYTKYHQVDDVLTMKLTVDACVVLVSILNVFNHPVRDSLTEFFDPLGMEENFVIHTGNLAKLLEGQDHMESCSFNQDFISNVEELLKAWMCSYRILVPDSTFEDLTQRYVDRLEMVEKKNLFYEQIMATTSELIKT